MSGTPQQIGPYTIDAEVGRGGMGVVYRAHDTRLDRAVAIKALPEHLAQEPERLARFEREARLLASLNHPNIAGIHGVEEHKGARYLVLEFVDGETLAERLDRGPLPIDEAVEVCAQIAAGVEAAHDAGVIHRDLKPGNVKITPDGRVKVLDFGLAFFEEGHASSASAHGESPTLTTPQPQHSPTIPGAILGTAAYMSPEQARGRPVDARTDIWSFGVVLYECLTGASPFVGETASDSIGAILHKPLELSSLPPGTPPAVRRALSRCLRRDRKERWRSIGDVRLELRSAGEEPEAASAQPGSRGARLAWAVACVAALIGVGGVVFGALRPGAPAPALVHAQLAAPDGYVFEYRSGTPAVSPDGRYVAFVASDAEDEEALHLFVRDLTRSEARRIDGVGDAWDPFWSPDSRSLGYFDGTYLRRIDLDGGAPDIVCEAPDAYGGGSWNEDGVIVFAMGRGDTIHAVPASGGASRPVTTLDRATNEFWHTSPHFLPDGRRFLFSTRRGIGGVNGVAIGSLDGGPHRRVLDVDSNAVYIDPGYVLFWRDGALRAQRFDPVKGEPAGDPVLVAAQTMFDPADILAQYSAAPGVLVFHSGGNATARSRLVLRDRTGAEIGQVGEDGNYYSPRLSHDGRFVAVDNSGVSNNGDIWIYGVSTPTSIRLTTDLADESRPIWSPDDRRVAFLTGTSGPDNVHVKPVSNPAALEVIAEDEEHFLEPTDWSPDSEVIALNRSLRDSGEDGDILFVNAADGVITPFMESPFRTEDLRFSPDGLWCAYTSDETGRSQVYIQSVEDPTERRLISTTGGDAPRWREDGLELFYRSLDDMLMAAPLPEGPSGDAGAPTALFRLGGRFEAAGDFDVAPDGQTILVNMPIREETSRPMSIVLNWMAEIEQR